MDSWKMSISILQTVVRVPWTAGKRPLHFYRPAVGYHGNVPFTSTDWRWGTMETSTSILHADGRNRTKRAKVAEIKIHTVKNPELLNSLF